MLLAGSMRSRSNENVWKMWIKVSILQNSHYVWCMLVHAWQYFKSPGTSLQRALCHYRKRTVFHKALYSVQIGMHHVLKTVLYTVQKNVLYKLQKRRPLSVQIGVHRVWLQPSVSLHPPATALPRPLYTPYRLPPPPYNIHFHFHPLHICLRKFEYKYKIPNPMATALPRPPPYRLP